MDLLWHINLEEMLGDLIVTTFLIMLAASVAVASLMVLLPLIDFAFEKKVKPTIEEPRHHDGLATHDEPWQKRRAPRLAPAAGELVTFGMADRPMD
jgi:hypothetical protein